MAASNVSNTFVQARDVVNIGLRLLEKELTIASLFFKTSGIDWSGRINDTVTVRVPQKLSAARKFGTGWRPNQNIGPTDGSTPSSSGDGAWDAYGQDAYGSRPAVRVDSVTETTTTLTIDEFIYKALGVTLEQLTLDIPSFAAQYLPQMVRVVADRIEEKCLTQLANTHWNTGTGGATATDYDLTYASTLTVDDAEGDAKAVIKGINTLRRALTANFVPLEGRTLIVGTGVEDKLILSDKFQRYDSVGDANALRNATVGRILGNEVVVNASIDPDEMFLLSPQSYLLHTVTPRQPEGAVQSGVASGNGLSLMYVQQYDNLHMEDVVVSSLFAGTNPVLDGPVDSGTRTMVRAAHASFDLATDE